MSQKQRFGWRAGVLWPVLILTVYFSISQGRSVSESQPNLCSRTIPVKPAVTRLSAESSVSHVVVKFRDEAEVRLAADRLHSRRGLSTMEAEKALQPYVRSNRLRRLFDESDVSRLEQRRMTLQFKSGRQLADLNGYYRLDVTDPVEAEQIINQLNALDIVELAYFEPVAEPAGDIDPPTPDYQPNQDYREAAPVGVDADYANTLPGGDGSGVTIVDIEFAWQETHEDLDKAVNGLIGGIETGERSHGTAVLGELIAGDNGYGVTGICPGADINMVSIGGISTAEALSIAVDSLTAGDIILIELNAPGPRYSFQLRADQLGYVCMEYWQANYDVIQYAWAKGITVIEAAGNGAEDYDDTALYGQLFDTTYRNSHAILGGAGYPATSDSDLYRQSFSNYGERVNLQGYGSGVYTTGYGSLFDGGGDENQYYTASFNGTSSASPIVAGAAACLQGYYEATYGVPMSSDQIRDILYMTGTAQQGDTSEHIGPRPDLLTAIAAVTSPPTLFVTPLMIDTTLDEGMQTVVPIWLHNRSLNDVFDFSIVDNDSLAKHVDSNWVIASPSAGTVPASDSVQVDVTLDATVIVDRVETYTGVLEISWGPGGASLDSVLFVPVFLNVPCFDTTYVALSSDHPGGPVYEWVSAKDLGLKIPKSLFESNGGNPLDDGATGPWDIGFDFHYYDTAYSEVYIGVNGAISFTDTILNIAGSFSGLTLPGAPFETFISPLWADLIFTPEPLASDAVYLYRSPNNDSLVIEWYHPSNFIQQGDTTMNFEIILTKFGEMTFQYRDLGESGLEMTALVGLSEYDCRAVSYYNTGEPAENLISDSEAVYFYNSTYYWVLAGDMDGEPELNVADLTYLVDYLFKGGPPPVPLKAGDLDECIGDINVADLSYLVDYLFRGGPAPCWYLG